MMCPNRNLDGGGEPCPCAASKGNVAHLIHAYSIPLILLVVQQYPYSSPPFFKEGTGVVLFPLRPSCLRGYFFSRITLIVSTG